jgi:hypothetical protein
MDDLKEWCISKRQDSYSRPGIKMALMNKKVIENKVKAMVGKE